MEKGMFEKQCDHAPEGKEIFDVRHCTRSAPPVLPKTVKENPFNVKPDVVFSKIDIGLLR